MDETPKEVDIFVDKYADLVLRIHSILKAKGLTEMDFAEKLGQKPSTVSSWLNGSQDITLRSIAKMEAELGETILVVADTSILKVKSSKGGA